MVDREYGPQTEATGDAPAENRREEQAPRDHPEVRGRLRSFTDVNLTIGQFLAGLEQRILHNRPPAIVVVDEEARGEQVTTSGIVIDGLQTEPLDRPEPRDTSGAKL